MERTIDEILAVDPDGLVILADEGDDLLLSAPRKDRSLSLDRAGWERLADVVSIASERARGHGLEVSFHPHISTYVELPEEIERLLELTDVSLTFDVGHIVLAGGDGVELFRAWRERVNHIHIKDVRRAVFEDFRASPIGGFNDWWPEVCTPLGKGDSGLDAFADAVRASGYDRWIVVEQDRAPLTVDSVDSVFADQAANLRWLHERFRPRG
jgi:inosose dehydratase